MPRDTITLGLSGEVLIEDFAKAIDGLKDLVNALADEYAHGAKIAWDVYSLEAGSAFATFQGVAEEAAGDGVQRVVEAYVQIGQTLESGGKLPYSPQIDRAVRRITGVLNGRIDSVRFETDETEAIIYSKLARRARAAHDYYAYGAIEGRVQTLSSRTGLRFILYDAFARAIPCYVSEGNEDMLRDAWDKWVVVEGRIRRDPTGKPVSIRKVANIEVIEDEGEPGGYRRTRGAVPVGPDGLSPEEAIRRLRDA
jgi:hypothetical protein